MVIVMLKLSVQLMCLSVGHTYDSNVIRNAKRVAYFGQVQVPAIVVVSYDRREY